MCKLEIIAYRNWLQNSLDLRIGIDFLYVAVENDNRGMNESR